MSSVKNSILIIDDDETDNFINTKLFNIMGIKDVTCFKNALDSIFYIHNVDRVPSTIFIDINMSLIDGFDIVRRFKKINRSFLNTKFYFLSNSLNPVDFSKARELDVTVIDKPLTFELINDILSKL